jgi:hypothetical protein
MTVASGNVPSQPRLARRVGAESAMAVLGLVLVAGAVRADQAWFDRHFMPVFFLSRAVQSTAEMAARASVAAVGVGLALILRPLVGRLVASRPTGALLAAVLRYAVAIALALAISELVLRSAFWRAIEAPPAGEEPLRRADDRLGWSFVPARTGRDTVGGRLIEYSFDREGFRVRSSGAETDFERPTLVFTGESIIAGYGLHWEESVPARVEALLGEQSANLAVFGFANDQAYLRLEAEPPSFRRPVAVVSIFVPTLFDRNFGDDRPHLGPGLTWLPALARSRLAALVEWLVPYRSDAALTRGIETTSAVLCATVALADARGAAALIVVPRFGPEGATAAMLRQRILDEPGLPHVSVELDPSWHLPGDSHPDPCAARAIAARLHER